MKTVDHRFNLDLYAEGAQVFRNVQQGDTAVRLIVTFSEEGKPYPLNSMGDNKVIALAAAKADTTYYYDDNVDIDYEANAAVITLPQQATAAAGLALCQFKLIDGGQIKASPMFCLNVTSNPYDEQEISPSSTDFLRLTNLIGEIEAKLENHEFDGEDGANGEDGFSPSASVSKVGDTATITITDKTGTTTATVKDGAKGNKGDKGDDGAEIISTNSFDNSVDPTKIYKVNRSGAQYLLFVIRSSTAVTQWRFQPKDESNNQTVQLEVRYGTVSTVGQSEIVNFGTNPWISIIDVLDLCTNNNVDSKISAAAYTKAQINQFLLDLQNLIPEKVSDLTNDSGFVTQQDISGKVDKTQKIAGIALSGNVSAADLVAAIIGNINPIGVNPDSTSGIGAQFGRTSDNKPVMHTLGSSWVKLALLSDVDGKMALALFYNSIDDDTQIKKGQFLVNGNEVWLKTAALGATGHKVLAEKAESLSGYGITDAYTKEQINGFITQITNAIPSRTSDLTNDSGFLTQHQDISGKVDKTRKIAGVDLQDDITASELKTALSVPTKTSQLTNDSNFLTQHQDISGKADIEDVPQYLRDLIDGNVAIKKYTASSAPPISETSESYTVPCLWEYNGDLWYVYEDTGTGGRHLYSSILLTPAIPDVSGKEDKSNKVETVQNSSSTTQYPSVNAMSRYVASAISGKADASDIPDVSGKENVNNKVEYVQDSSSATQYPSIKAMTTYVTNGLSNKEATTNRVSSINASSDNNHYPTALAVKNYVDTVIGGIENGSY